MRYTRQTILGAAVTMVMGGFAVPAYAQSPWSALVGTCASTDNNFFSGTPSVNFPVTRFITPGGSLTFNRFHQGYIAVLCTVDNPRDNITQHGISCTSRIGIRTGCGRSMATAWITRSTLSW